MSASIIRRHIIGGFVSRRFFCSGGMAELARSSATCLMLAPTFERGGGMVYNYIRLKEGDVEMGSFRQRGGKVEADLMRDRKTKWVGSSHGWLALFNSRNREMCLLNPVSGRRVELPPCRGDPFVEKEEHPVPYKVVISHSPKEEECHAVMILGSLDRAAFCRPGRCSAWTPFDSISTSKILYGDFVYSASRKGFFGSFRSESGGREDLGRCNFGEAKMEVVVNAPFAEYDPQGPKSTWMTYLVSDEESGGLFLVRRYLLQGRKIGVDVYRVIIGGGGDGGSGGVELCSSLDDLAMFIGINQSFVSKGARPPNTICFSGNWFDADQFMDHFDYGTKTCILKFPAGVKHDYRSPPPWFTPSLD